MKRQRIFYAIFLICAAGIILSSVSGVRRTGEVVYKKPDYSFFETDDGVSSYVAEGAESPSESRSDESAPEYTVNINTASAEELSRLLPGIGDKKARSIVEYREAVGGFMSVDELLEVDGIGQATLERIRPYCVTE